MTDPEKLNVLDENELFITEKHIFFFGSVFSNFYPTSFLYTAFNETHRFFTSEQAFMWHKAMTFGDTGVAQQILMENTDPYKCKQLGRNVANYDDEKWGEIRYGVFLAVNTEKFTQDEKLNAFIKQEKFDGRMFVEASPYDKIWGIRMAIGDPEIDDETKWRGQNLLGKCITEVRNRIIGK
jgi:ribA/ribD-fused uncharacterized protein